MIRSTPRASKSPVTTPRRPRARRGAGRAVALVVTLLVAIGLASCATPPAPPPQKPSQPLVVGAGAAPSSAPAAAAAPEDDAVIPIHQEDAVRGSRLAFVTVVVFSDFQCPYCSKLVPTLERLAATYGEDDLRVVFKNHPLPFHPHARLAAEIGQGVVALGGSEAFWRFQATAFRGQSAISPEALRTWATASGVDARALEEGLASKRWAAKVDADVALAEQLGATGTPASFINGVLVSGAQPFESFKATVDEELQKARSLVERGVARDQAYTRLVAANFQSPPRGEDASAQAAAREAKAAAEAKIVYKVPAGRAPIRGPKTAQVTIVEFSDFQCPFCKRVEETLGRVRQAYGDKVRVLWRDRPLAFHKRAEPAAELARAARAQKGDAGFWKVHDLLFDSQAGLEDEDLERVAREAKLDVKAAMAAVKARTYRKAIQADVTVGDDFKVAGTPHFFVNGRRLVGAVAFERFKEIIDEEIAKADALLASGTSRAALYDALVKDGQAPAEPERRSIGAAPAKAPFRGAANGKVVIQQVSDFQCPFCKKVEATLDELIKAYPGKIKVVWRDKPLPFHTNAVPAAEAAREAYAQKGNAGFDKMRRLLFDNQRSLERADLDGYARAVGLDMDKFAAALDAHTHKAAIEADDKATTDAGVKGTPAFFIGPYFLSGAQPIDKFRRLVERVLNPPPAPKVAR